MVLRIRQITMFDTSGVNRLADDPNSEALIAELGSGYFVRFPFTTVGEIIASSSGRAQETTASRVSKALASGGRLHRAAK